MDLTRLLLRINLMARDRFLANVNTLADFRARFHRQLYSAFQEFMLNFSSLSNKLQPTLWTLAGKRAVSGVQSYCVLIFQVYLLQNPTHHSPNRTNLLRLLCESRVRAWQERDLSCRDSASLRPQRPKGKKLTVMFLSLFVLNHKDNKSLLCSKKNFVFLILQLFTT